jgi:hypothetical protein
MAMALHRIVEHLNKIKYLTLSFFTGRVYFSLDNPLLKRSKKAFGNCVVVTITPAVLIVLRVPGNTAMI